MMNSMRLLSLLLLLAASVRSFQPAFSTKSLSFSAGRRSRETLLFGEPPADGAESKSDDSQEVTDLDKATFEIAKDYAETGLPEDAPGGSQADFFT